MNAGTQFMDRLFLRNHGNDVYYERGVVEKANKVKEIFKVPTEINNRAESFIQTETGDDSVKNAVAVVDMVEKFDRSDERYPLAKEFLDQFTDSVYLAIRDGDVPNSYKLALKTGSEMAISNSLPDPLKGLARELSLRVINNNEITAIINQVDEFAYENLWPEAPPSENDRAKRFEEAEKALRALKVGDAERGQLVTAVQYVVAMEKSDVNLQTEAYGRQIRPDRLPVTNAEGQVEFEQMTYDMTYKRFVELESQIRGIHWYAERPPAWFEQLSPDQRCIVEARIELLNAAASKKALRNADLEKVRLNVPETPGADLKQLWDKMPGYSKAVRYILRDLCEQHTDQYGRRLLRLKLEKDEKGNVISKKIDEATRKKVEYLSGYKKQVAVKLMEVNKALSKTEAIEATSAAWNFLYIGDLIESADLYRELTPSTALGDQVRTADHLKNKAYGKWGVQKQFKGVNEVVTSPGMQEPFVSLEFYYWIKDQIKSNPGFKDRMIDGDLKNILPETMCVSWVEATKMGNTNWATALMLEKHDGTDVYDDKSISNSIAEDDKNVMQPFNDMREGAFWLATAFKGKIKYDAKNSDILAGIAKSVSLVRQEPHIPLEKGGMAGLASVDIPEFYAYLLAIMVGFDPFHSDIFLDPKVLGVTDGSSYCKKIKDIVKLITVDSPVDQEQILKILNANDAIRAGTILTKRSFVEMGREIVSEPLNNAVNRAKDFLGINKKQ